MKKVGEYSFEEVLARAAAYCSLAEKCVADVQTKLAAWGISLADSDKIIKWLKTEKFIDEQRFAVYFVKDKFRFNRWGRVKIAAMLAVKQIDRETVQIALNEIDEEEYLETLRHLLRDKAKSVKAASDYEKRGKLFRFAAGRGFELKVIEQALSKL